MARAALGSSESAMHAPWALTYPHSLAVGGEEDTAELSIPGIQIQGQETGKDQSEAGWEGAKHKWSTCIRPEDVRMPGL